MPIAPGQRLVPQSIICTISIRPGRSFWQSSSAVIIQGLERILCVLEAPIRLRGVICCHYRRQFLCQCDLMEIVHQERESRQQHFQYHDHDRHQHECDELPNGESTAFPTTHIAD